MKKALCLSVLAALAAPLLAQEPSLAELAERQKKARTGQTKVITEADLKRVGRPYVPADVTDESAKPEAAAAASPGSAKEKPAEEERAEKRADIEKQIKRWTDFIAETRAQMDKAQLEVNDLGSLTWGDRRAGLQKILDEGKQLIADAEASIAELREQARRAGIPLSI